MMTEGSIEVNVDVLTSVTAMFFLCFMNITVGETKNGETKKNTR